MSNRKESICKIIEACGKNGVKSIKFDGVEINFEGNSRKEETILTPIDFNSTHPAIADYKVEEDIFAEEDKEIQLEMDFSTLMIEDPEKYEELIANGKLENFGAPDA